VDYLDPWSGRLRPTPARCLPRMFMRRCWHAWTLALVSAARMCPASPR